VKKSNRELKERQLNDFTNSVSRWMKKKDEERKRVAKTDFNPLDSVTYVSSGIYADSGTLGGVDRTSIRDALQSYQQLEQGQLQQYVQPPRGEVERYREVVDQLQVKLREQQDFIERMAEGRLRLQPLSGLMVLRASFSPWAEAHTCTAKLRRVCTSTAGTGCLLPLRLVR
jgi:hypothetical protein